MEQQTELNAGLELPATDFDRRLIAGNGLAEVGFSRWVFYPGMLFDSSEKWWGQGGRRTRPHEGLDICLFMDAGDTIFRIDQGAQIPALYAGRVVSIIEDYVGKSLFVRHGVHDTHGRQLYTIYGHTDPSGHCAAGLDVHAGDIIAVIADFARKGAPMLPHVHLSLAWITQQFPQGKLTWEALSGPLRGALVNPLDIIRRPSTTVVFNPADDQTALPCGRAQ